MSAVGDGELRVAAPNYEAAKRLAELLERCQCLLVQDGKDGWAVTARPWQSDGRALADALSAIERWVAEIGARKAEVMVGERPFTLAPAP